MIRLRELLAVILWCLFLLTQSPGVFAEETYTEQSAHSHHKKEKLMVYRQSFSTDQQSLIPVPIYIAGNGPYLFGLDSGAPGCLSQDLVKALGLVPSITSTSKYPRVNVDYYQLGEMKLPGSKDLEVYDLSEISRGVGFQEEGIMGGLNLLPQLITTIDYPQNRLVIYYDNQPAQQRYAQYLLKTPQAVAIPFLLSNQTSICHYPLVEVSVNGKEPALMVVDTGSGYTVLDKEYAQSIGVLPVSEMGEVTVVTIHSNFSFPLTDIGSLSIGGRTVEEVPCLLEDYTVWMEEGGYSQQAVVGILGVNFLSHFKVTFNYRRQELVLE
jgi:predicted aspartyl protease